MKNLKKVIALVAVFAMLVSTVAFAQSYTDVKDGDNYAEAIEMLSSLNILTGDKDDNGNAVFRPNDTITRAEVAAIVERMQNIYVTSNSATEFKDVPSSHWASGYIAQAAAAGIINGYGDGTFGPEDDVLYEQAIKMVVEAIGYAPFVKDNGGYYAGHLLAAQRYGVLDGVVGGSIGAKATRGQVAQLVYNAVDTPIMDRYSYGDEAKYTIYHGKNGNDFETLLTRDLGVVKGSGVVVENRYTNIANNTAKSIDTDDEEEIVIDYNLDNDYHNYDLANVKKIYANGTDAGKSIGKEVTFYLKETSKKGEYNVLNVSETSRNKTLTISLDDFKNYVQGTLTYFKEDSRGTVDQAVNLTSVIFNGVADSNCIAYTPATSSTPASLTENANNIKTLLTGSAWSGQITLIDNGKTNGYNIMSVEIASPAVIDEVNANGKVTFINTPRVKGANSAIKLNFDEDDKTQVIELTKDGQPYDYTQLKKWDVLSILKNDSSNYYVIDVIDAGKISSTVSEVTSSTTSYGGSKYLIDGNYYDVAEGAYVKGLGSRSSGVFYIDNYGKIVAYDKKGTTTSSDAYAYIINSNVDSDAFGVQSVYVKYLDKTGAVGSTTLADNVTIENVPYATAVATFGYAPVTGTQPTVVDISVATKDYASALATLIKDELVTYKLSGDRLKTITLAQGSEDEGTLYKHADGTSVTYSESNQRIKVGAKNCDVDESTIVFFITTGTNAPVYNNGFVNTASATASKVAAYTSLSDTTTYDYGQVYDYDDVASVVVLFNTSGGVLGSSNVAVIDSVGTATVDDSEVTSVTYWMNGVKATAYTDEDYVEVGGTIKNAKQGDVWKFSVNGSTITEGRKVVGYARTTAWGPTGAATFTTTLPLSVNATSSNAETVDYGPIVGYKDKKIQYATPILSGSSVTGYDFDNTNNLKVADDVNVYVYDPVKRADKVYVGSGADASYDSELVKQANNTVNATSLAVYKKGVGTPEVVSTDAALGLMDFALAVSYDGDIQDIIIYKSSILDKYEVK